jgi:thymidylate synthase
MKLPITYIEATTIPDAWFQCIAKIQEVGFRYVIQHGSYVGQTRLEFDWITVQITHPYSDPWDTMLPDIPSHLGIPNPVENGYLERYMPYLMTENISDKETYTYGSRIIVSLDKVINILKTTPNTNQAILQVAMPEDINLSDPPCLRHIDLRVKDGCLVSYPIFRSNDLWGGFPANIASITILQKYIADEVGLKQGAIIYCSKGLHLYGYAEELAKLRVGGIKN